MHLADALGVPLVALYGVGRLPLWQPSAPRSRALHHQGDADFRQLAPTPANATEAQSFLARITVAEVLAALGQLPSR
jgi:ADP-heptose:LPS heptosyltransferase